MTMRFASAASLSADSREACREALERIRASLDGARPDLTFLFVSRHHVPALEKTAASLAEGISAGPGGGLLVGATGEGVIEGSAEHEDRPALALWAASLPGVRVTTSHAILDRTPDGDAFLGVPAPPLGTSTMVLIGDPFSFDAAPFIERIVEDAPDCQVLGGMASGARTPGQNRVIVDGSVHAQGALAVLLSGPLRVRPVVSQGCRPFGRPLVVTRVDGPLILELGGRPIREKLDEQLKELSPADRSLVEKGLHLGLAIDARKVEHRRGDFLVRNVVGYVPERGALIVTDRVRTGMTVQFHLRDASTASEDLSLLLKESHEAGSRPLGGLLFSCNGRGSRLFSRPNHDAEAIRGCFGDLPLAGFFAAGEIGPVGGRSFLHGFTASVALFEEP